MSTVQPPSIQPKVVTRVNFDKAELSTGDVQLSLFNLALARQSGGQFYIRAKAPTPELLTLGIMGDKPDIEQGFSGHIRKHPEIIHPNQRGFRYLDVAQELVKNSHGYFCWDGTSNRYRTPSQNPRWGDPFTTRLNLQRLILDPVILDIHGNASEEFGQVVDDIDANVTHLISRTHPTQTQLAVYAIVEKQVPSIRRLDVSDRPLNKLLERFSVEVVVNYLMRLGWHDHVLEIWSMEEFIKKFDISKTDYAEFNVDDLEALQAFFTTSQKKVE